jgi:hypothetical protein
VPAPTCSVSYNRSSVTSGGSATLSWSSNNDADGNMEFSCTNFYQSSPGVMTYNGSGRSSTTSASGGGTATWNTSVNSSEKCTFTAKNSTGSVSCSDTLVVNAPSYYCTGTTPTNANFCPNDNVGLTANTPRTVVSSCGAPKCETTSKSGYTKSGNSCVAISINASCGTRDTTYSASTPAWPSSSTYCSSGTNTTSPAFPAPNNSVSWTCAGSGGGSNDYCTATRSNISSPSLSFWANPSTITLGDSTSLRYSVSGATSCTASTSSFGAGSWSGWRSYSNGTHYYSVTPTYPGAKTYKLSCSNSGGTTIRHTYLTVVPSPTCSVSYNKSSITSGESATLTWSSTNDADGKMEYTCTNFENVNNSVLEYNEIGRSGTIGDYNATATWDSLGNNTSETCTFTAENSAGATANCSDTLIVNAPGIYSCQSIPPIPDYASAWGSDEYDAINNTTNWTYSPTDDPATKCQYRCNTGYTWNGSACVNPQFSFEAVDPITKVSLGNPVDISSGDSIRLTWSVQDMINCVASGDSEWFGINGVKGSVDGITYLQDMNNIDSDRSYTLTCFGKDSNEYKGIIPITVVPIATFSCTNIPPNTTPCPGDDTGLSADTNGAVVDSCSVPPELEKCEYTCNAGLVNTAGVCLPPTCIGSIDSNAEICPGDTANESRTLVENCSTPDGSDPKCEYVCKSGFDYNSATGACELNSSSNKPANWQEVNP